MRSTIPETSFHKTRKMLEEGTSDDKEQLFGLAFQVELRFIARHFVMAHGVDDETGEVEYEK